MLLLRCFAVVLGLASMATSAFAFDLYGKVAKARPEMLDLSSSVSSRGGYFSATYTLESPCPPMNAIHSWDVALIDREGNPLDGAEVTIDADMPEHLHGMMTKPQVLRATSPGTFRVDGMKFHMPGWWVITLDVSKGRGRDLAYFNIVVGEGACQF